MVQNFARQTNSLILYIVSFFINARDFNRFLKSSGKWLIVISYAVYSGATLPEEGPPRVRLADPSPACPGVRSVVKIRWQTIRQIDLTDEKKFVAYLSIRGHWLEKWKIVPISENRSYIY